MISIRLRVLEPFVDSFRWSLFCAMMLQYLEQQLK